MRNFLPNPSTPVTEGPLSQVLSKVSPIVYGCMGLGGSWEVDGTIESEHITQAHEAVDAALESGINFFDHADIYRRGRAETVFSEVLKARPELREQIYLQSKCAIRFEDEHGPKRYDFSKEWIERSVDGILSRLNVEYLDTFLLHRPDPLMEPEEIARSFESLRASGKVRHFGASNMHGAQLAFLQSYLDEPLVVNQVEISLTNLGWLDEGVYAGNPAGQHVNFAPGTLEYCRLNKVQIQSWGSLSQGLFSGRDVSAESESIQTTAKLVASLAEKYDTSKEAIVLAWILRHPAHIQPIVGSASAERIRACAAAPSIALTREDWYALYVSARGEELP